MTLFNPFFINTNLCYTQKDCQDLPTFLNNIAGNTGNSYIAYSVLKLLYGKIFPVAEIKNLWSYNFDKQDELIAQINNQYSHVILFLQDQIRLEQSYGVQPDWKKINGFLSKLKKPFIVFSLGANDFGQNGPDWWKKLPKDFLQFLHIVSEHSVSLGVRGLQTLEILEKLGIKNAKAVGCPTFFETGPNKQIIKKPLTKSTDILRAGSLDFRSQRLLSGVIQDETALIELLYFKQFSTTPLATKPSFPFLLSIATGGMRCFAGIEKWKEFVSQFTCCISSRMHGGILALNCGVPAVLVNKDLRAKEMCQLFKIPNFAQTARQYSWEELYQQADFEPLNKQYPVLYKAFTSWLAENGLTTEIIKQARQTAENIPPIQEPELPPSPHFSQWLDDILKTKYYYIPTQELIKLLIQKI